MQLKTPAEIFNANAALYQERFMDVSSYSKWLNIFAGLLPANAHVLDVGCGPGNIALYLQQLKPGIKLTGVDTAPNMIELAKVNMPAGDFMVMEAKDISTLPQQYDGVVLGFCMPYLSGDDMRKLITDAATLLKVGGALYLSTMEEDEHNSSGVRTTKNGSVYMYYHKEADIVTAIQHAGLSITTKDCQPYSDANGSATDLLIIAQKK